MSLDAKSFKGLSRFLAPSAGGPLADRALSESLISPEQLHECVDEQDRSGRPLDEILVERGYLKAEQVTRLRQPALPPEVAQASEDPRRHLGHYVLVSLLGVGGMAEVWKAWDRSLGRWVAVKYLKEDVGHPTQRIEREGRMAGSLSHPGIITIFERGQHEGRPYLVMPFVDGSPPRSPLPPREAARLACEVAVALVHAHEMGVIHRDVKPANILVEAGGRVVLADFGLAIAGGSATSLWAMSGTPEYASPEQVRGDVLDARTDIYSLGATLYHLLMGRPPFTGHDVDEIGAQVLRADPPPLRGVPGPLAAAVGRAMARERERRYATMGEFAGDLRRFVERSKGGLLRSRGGAIGAAVLAGLLSWGLTYWALTRSTPEDPRLAVLTPLSEARSRLIRAERLRLRFDASPEQIVSLASGALTLFDYARKLAGGSLPEASVGIARAYELMGYEGRAEEEYRTAHPHADARVGLARLYLGRHLEGRTDRDWRGMAKAEIDPLRAPGGEDRVDVLWNFAAGRLQEALDRSVRAAESEPADGVLHLVVGAAAVELGRWDPAVASLDRVLRLRRDDPVALYYKGVALEGKGNKLGARAAFQAALVSAPPTSPLRSQAETRLARLSP